MHNEAQEILTAIMCSRVSGESTLPHKQDCTLVCSEGRPSGLEALLIDEPPIVLEDSRLPSWLIRDFRESFSSVSLATAALSISSMPPAAITKYQIPRLVTLRSICRLAKLFECLGCACRMCALSMDILERSLHKRALQQSPDAPNQAPSQHGPWAEAWKLEEASGHATQCLTNMSDHVEF